MPSRRIDPSIWFIAHGEGAMLSLRKTKFGEVVNHAIIHDTLTAAGLDEGAAVGDLVRLVGSFVGVGGLRDGLVDGKDAGSDAGDADGAVLGFLLGLAVEVFDGLPVGAAVGVGDGTSDGAAVGDNDGTEGEAVGVTVGAVDGEAVGAAGQDTTK
jgi:hypothetical protein